MITHKRLVQNTPAIIKERARACHIKPKRDGRYVSHQKNIPAYELSYIVHCTDGARRVLIRYIGSDKPVVGKMVPVLGFPDENTKVWVSCSCPFHMFYTEYALAQIKSSDILYGNGQPPVIKNPGRSKYCCKHIILALSTALKDYKSLSKDKKLQLSLQPIQPKKKEVEPKIVIPKTPIKKLPKEKVQPKTPIPAPVTTKPVKPTKPVTTKPGETPTKTSPKTNIKKPVMKEITPSQQPWGKNKKTEEVKE